MTAQPLSLYIDVPADVLTATVEFWSEALGATPRRPADDPYVRLDGARSVLAVVVQRIDSGAARYHVDLGADDVDLEADRLAELGATKHERHRTWWTLTDPAGNWLCTIRAGHEAAALAPRRPDRGYLEVLFVDVPEELVEPSIAFWRDTLGASAAPSDDEAYTSFDGITALGGALTFYVQRVDDEPRYHVDLVVDDVAAETERLVACGASRVRQIEDWWVLADPAGNLLCVVPADH